MIKVYTIIGLLLFMTTSVFAATVNRGGVEYRRICSTSVTYGGGTYTQCDWYGPEGGSPVCSMHSCTQPCYGGATEETQKSGDCSGFNYNSVSGTDTRGGGGGSFDLTPQTNTIQKSAPTHIHSGPAGGLQLGM